VATRIGIAKILLTGGCFQNARLTERAVVKLRQAGFAPYWHARVPPNDGGLAVGQAAFAARPLIEENR
jgi:hydrogenase maturation protein HypF